MSKKGKYGEPWDVFPMSGGVYGICNNNFESIVEAHSDLVDGGASAAGFLERGPCGRAIACVNALDGCEPEVLLDLLSSLVEYHLGGATRSVC